MASGIESTAAGFLSTATGLGASALGAESVAGGDYSTAVGLAASANGLSSTAVGEFSVAAGDEATAVGGTAFGFISTEATGAGASRSEEPTSELQSLMSNSYAVF